MAWPERHSSPHTPSCRPGRAAVQMAMQPCGRNTSRKHVLPAGSVHAKGPCLHGLVRPIHKSLWTVHQQDVVWGVKAGDAAQVAGVAGAHSDSSDEGGQASGAGGSAEAGGQIRRQQAPGSGGAAQQQQQPKKRRRRTSDASQSSAAQALELGGASAAAASNDPPGERAACKCGFHLPVECVPSPSRHSQDRRALPTLELFRQPCKQRACAIYAKLQQLGTIGILRCTCGHIRWSVSDVKVELGLSMLKVSTDVTIHLFAFLFLC